MNESGTGAVVAVHINEGRTFVFVSDCCESSGEWVEMNEGNGQGMFELFQQIVDETAAIVDGGGRFGVKKTFLDVLDGEHEKIPWAKVIWVL